MTINFTGPTNIDRSQIGDNNTYINESLSEDDWKVLENFFAQKLNNYKEGSDLYDFLDKSQKYTSKRDKRGLRDFFKKNCTDFLKNTVYNIASAQIISLLQKLGIFL